MLMPYSLEGEVAIVIGGGGGLAEGICSRLAEAGCAKYRAPLV